MIWTATATMVYIMKAAFYFIARFARLLLLRHCISHFDTFPFPSFVPHLPVLEVHPESAAIFTVPVGILVDPVIIVPILVLVSLPHTPQGLSPIGSSRHCLVGRDP